MTDPETLLRSMFQAAVDAALPDKVISDFLPARPEGRLVVVGAGKASAAMARAFEQAWDGPLSGLVVTRYDHAVPCESIEIVEAAHPVPDAAGADAARRMLEIADSLGDGDVMVALISGGGSSLLTAPCAGVSLADKQALNRALLASGASIDEMNCVRKHVSAVKGGRLAAAAFPAACHTLVISDVPGDDPADIASGPTVGDETTLAQAREIVARYAMVLPQSVIAALNDPANESPAPDDPRLSRASTQIIAAPQASLLAAARVAEAAGIALLILGDALEGEARVVGKVMAGIAASCTQHGQPIRPPCVLISGGETTVTLPKGAAGRGGRNVEFLMGFAAANPGVWAIACDTDGVDGAAEVAGAILRPDTPLDTLAAAMADYDGHGFFEAVGGQVVTGPTLTNVNDFRAILIL
ncbi:glycerate-2-kinase [Rubricella aquisinus]|uniref:Glycerate-2-kinase n=1 Tax=Rubricella aquisinus TaxID=2028108 RepID=A0A840WJ66_9RHOB|nr:glycerate kinase [Rubricella aquisinus]MBB5515148.1 glycerate-2-kinase [Rubricella aquisinus]